MRLVLASGNRKKLAELALLLGPVGVELIAQTELGIGEAEEPHPTFVENALQKARHAARLSGLAAIADDSGLCVDALGGAPGVISAHYAPVALPAADREAQRAVQDTANNALLLERLHGIGDRRAHFIATLVAVRADDDPEPLIAVGRWFGAIAEAPRGANGFGYDPLMVVAPFGRAVAELDAAVKNSHGHRALAALQMRALMREAWHVG